MFLINHIPPHPSLFNDPWADIPSHQLPFSVNKYTIRPKDKCRGRGEHARRSQTMFFYLKNIIINLRVKCLELSFAGWKWKDGGGGKGKGDIGKKKENKCGY